jgi:hypothetical protein
MANLAFPQLTSGAMAQYPLRKRRVIQSAVNTFADGSMITANLNANTQRVWELSYTDLTSVDRAALQNLFVTCQGPLMPFVFIDPTDNMLGNSGDLTSGAWMAAPLLSVTGGAPDPLGGNTAFMLVNDSQVDQQVSQIIMAPANFQYCFSLYAMAAVNSPFRLGLNTSASQQSQTFTATGNWRRLAASVELTDNETTFSASIIVPAAQTVVVWGPQLEPQLSPSRYRVTAASGGVYQNAHFLGNSLTFESDAPGLFSTVISIETT